MILILLLLLLFRVGGGGLFPAIQYAETAVLKHDLHFSCRSSCGWVGDVRANVQGQYCYIRKRCTSLQEMRLPPFCTFFFPLSIILLPLLLLFLILLLLHRVLSHHPPPPPSSLSSPLPPFLFSYLLSLFIAATSEISLRVSPRATRNTSKDAYCSRQTGQNQVYRTFLRTLQGNGSTASYNTLFRIWFRPEKVFEPPSA